MRKLLFRSPTLQRPRRTSVPSPHEPLLYRPGLYLPYLRQLSAHTGVRLKAKRFSIPKRRLNTK